MVQLLGELRGFLMRIGHVAKSNRRLRTVAPNLNHALLREDVLRELTLADELQTGSTNGRLPVHAVSGEVCDADLA